MGQKIVDKVSYKVRKPKHINILYFFTATACIFCFCIGVIFTTGAGEYWLGVFDSYGATGLTLIALAEILSIMYLYGHEKFTADIKTMTGVTLSWYWQATWRFIAPILLFVIFIASLIMQCMNWPTYSAWDKTLVSI